MNWEEKENKRSFNEILTKQMKQFYTK